MDLFSGPDNAAPTETALLLDVGREAARQFGSEKFAILRSNATQGPTTFKTLAFFGGIASIAVGTISILGHFLFLNWIGAAIDLYLVIFGGCVLLLEARNSVLPRKYKIALNTNFKLLSLLAGRGALYLFMSTLLLSRAPDLLPSVLGLYWLGVAGLHLGYGYLSSKKLAVVAVSSFVGRGTCRQLTSLPPPRPI